MRASLFAAFILSLELAPAAGLRIPLPLQSPSPLLSSAESRSLSAGAERAQTEIEKRRKSHEDDSDDSGSRDRHESSSKSKAAKDVTEEGDEKRPGRGKRPHKGKDDDSVHKTTNDHDDDGESKSEGGKKQKHVPGSHHRDDRVNPSPPHGGHRKGRGGKHGKRYLSSNPRYHPKRTLSVWDYDRHSKRMGDFDPLHGTGLREEKRGHGREGREDGEKDERHGERAKDRHDHSKAEDKGRHGTKPTHFSFAALAEGASVRGDSLPNDRIGGHGDGLIGVQAKGVPSHRQGVTLGDGSASAHSLAALSSTELHSDHVGRGLLDPLLVDGILDMDYEAYDCEDESPFATHPRYMRRDGEGDNQWHDPNTPPPPSAPSSPPQVVSVLDGGQRMYADKIIWQPKSAHPEKEGGLQKRRKDKHKNKHDRHGDEDEDDEDEDEGDNARKKGKARDRGGDEEEEEDLYGASTDSRKKKGKGRYDDEEEDRYGRHGDEDDYDGPRSISKSAKHAGYGEDDHASSKQGEDEYDGPHSSQFDDGQYHPSANSNKDDCATLSAFYTSMRGETWTPVVDWSSSVQRRSSSGWSGVTKSRCCSWTGITCDEYHRVIGLNLPNQGLAGPLSDELFSLDALLRLDLSGNALTALPDRFTSLPTLANVNAASNNLTGSIPTSLLSHPTLKTLNLASNAFVGDVSLNSVNLTSVALGKNQLSSFHVIEGRELVKVDIADNAFQGALPDLSSSLDLQIFDASSNNLRDLLSNSTGNLFDLSRMTALTRLDVRSNSLSGPFPPTLAHLKRLTSLYLSYNAFTGQFPSEPAPPALSSCYVMPNQVSPCPSDVDLANPSSLAARCHASCPKQGARTAGIPVSPLPGEAGQRMPLYLHPSSSYVLAPDVHSQPQSPSQPQPPMNLNGFGSVKGMPAPAEYNQPPPGNNVNANGLMPPAAFNNVGMDASSDNMGSTRQQQMVGAASPIKEVPNSASSRKKSLMGGGSTAEMLYLVAPLLLALPAW